MRVEYPVTIYAPAERAWATLVEVERWPHWTDSVTSLDLLDGPLAVGGRVRIVQPRTRATVWTVTELDEHRRLTWIADRPGLHLEADHQLTPAGSGAVVVHLTFRMRGALVLVAGPLTARRVRRYLEWEALGLKAYVQAGYGIAPDT